MRASEDLHVFIRWIPSVGELDVGEVLMRVSVIYCTYETTYSQHKALQFVCCAVRDIHSKHERRCIGFLNASVPTTPLSAMTYITILLKLSNQAVHNSWWKRLGLIYKGHQDVGKVAHDIFAHVGADSSENMEISQSIHSPNDLHEPLKVVDH